MKLSIVRELKEEIEEKAALIENLRGTLEKVSAPTLDGLPKAKFAISANKAHCVAIYREKKFAKRLGGKGGKFF